MRSFILTSTCLLAIASPALADPTFGLGLSVAFGGGGAPQTGVGLRVFSDDQPHSYVASAGVDYMITSRTVRGTLGAAYLDKNAYVGLDMGLGFAGGGLTYGLSIGAVNTNKPAAAPVVDNGGQPALAF
jgi:hypothetical protein